MSLRLGAIKILTLVSVSLVSVASARYDIARSDFKENTYVGPIILDESKLEEWNYAETEEDLALLKKHQQTNLFSTLIDLSSIGIKPYLVPDVNYPVVLDRDADGNLQFSNSNKSMGLNLIPVGSSAPVYRITDENRVKFRDRLVDPNTGRELGRVVDEETFDRVTQEIAQQKREQAPMLTIRDFDDDGDKKGIATIVKDEQADGLNLEVYNTVTKGIRDAIAELPAPAQFDEKWFDETYPKILESLGLKDLLSEETMLAVIGEQKAQLQASGAESDFNEEIFDKVAQSLTSKALQMQRRNGALDTSKLRTGGVSACESEYRTNESNMEHCRNSVYYISWAFQSKLPLDYAKETLYYSYSQAISNRRFNDSEFWDAVWRHRELVAEANPDSVSVKVVDRLVRQSMYKDAGIDDSRHMYAIVGHTSANEAIYKDLAELTKIKVQTSIHHVSAYYGANGYTRRGFLEGGQPNNIYTVTVKGVDQEAFNLNAKIWAKIYYENPDDHYQFADDYEFDEFENTTLRRVLEFGRAWIDKEWINKPLNSKFVKYAQEADIGLSAEELAAKKKQPYYKWLLEDSVFGLYCFEGVTNQLNVALNIPLTEKYLQRIYGEAEGEKLFKLVNERWLLVLLNEGIPGTYNKETKEFTGEVTQFDLKKLEGTLSKFKPLWELKGTLTNPNQYTSLNPLSPDLDENGAVVGFSSNPVRDREYNKVGNSLAWVPQTTGDILADLIEMYVPFHKTKAAISSGVILNFQAEHERRTGITKETYMAYALPIILEMFKAEASLVLKGLPAQAPVAVAKANYIAENKKAFQAMLSKPNEEGEARPAQEVTKLVSLLFDGNPRAGVPGIAAVVEASSAIADADIQAANGDAKYAAWLNFKKSAKAVLAKANQTPVAITDSVLAHLQGTKFVKFYTRPGVLQSMVAGSWPTNPHILLRAVGTVISDSWTKPKVENTDLLTYDYRANDQFVRDFAEQAEQFRTQPVKDEDLVAHAARLYDAKVIGVEDGNSSDAERRVREAARELQ